MRIFTKGLMGAFVAASVLGTTPLHAGVTTPAKAPGYHEFEQASDFHRKRKHHRHYARGERIGRDSRVWRGNDGRYYCKKDNGTTATSCSARCSAPRAVRSSAARSTAINIAAANEQEPSRVRVRDPSTRTR